MKSHHRFTIKAAAMTVLTVLLALGLAGCPAVDNGPKPNPPPVGTLPVVSISSCG